MLAIQLLSAVILVGVELARLFKRHAEAALRNLAQISKNGSLPVK